MIYCAYVHEGDPVTVVMYAPALEGNTRLVPARTRAVSMISQTEHWLVSPPDVIVHETQLCVDVAAGKICKASPQQSSMLVA